MQRDSEGRALDSLTQTLNMRLVWDTYEETMKDGLHLIKKLELKSGAEEVRVVVRDVPSGSIGSVNIPLIKPKEKTGT